MTSSPGRLAHFRRAVVTTVGAAAALATGGCDEEERASYNPPTCSYRAVQGCVPDYECPSGAPTALGGECALEEPECRYEDYYCQGLGLSSWPAARCLQGRWGELSEYACPTTKEGCPPQLPAEGAFCDTYLPFPCDYAGCERQPTASARCVVGQWHVEENCRAGRSTTGECPVQRPAEASSCTVEPEVTCPYGGCDGEEAVVARCFDGEWTVSGVLCRHPADEAPPQEDP